MHVSEAGRIVTKTTLLSYHISDGFTEAYQLPIILCITMSHCLKITHTKKDPDCIRFLDTKSWWQQVQDSDRSQ